MKFLQLKCIPQSTDFALLLLRLMAGLLLFLNHGLAKLVDFAAMSSKFPSILGIGHAPSLVLAIFAEVVCAALVVLGWWTRFAALMIVIELGTAFILVHHLKLTPGPGSGELAFLYLTAMVTILFAGGGRFALEQKKSGV
jgi:putative oxidoreductase